MAKFDRDRSYGIDRDEELGEGLKRVAAGRVEEAIGRLRGIRSGEVDPADAVHGARKDMKKLRTVLRLLRAELPEDLYRAEMRCYREAARALSAARDAEVKLATLDDLAGRTQELPGEAVAAWQQILARDREAAINLSGDEQEVADRLEAGLARIEGWRIEGDSWAMIGGAVKRAYRRGRRAMRAAEKDPSETHFHQWRKRAKDLWYELRLLSGAWSETLGPVADEAHRLSDLLGDHHDLAVLRADLHERRLGEEETRLLEAAIEARQAELAREAFALGRRLYAERPKAFGRRLRRYWEAWRG
ncbi:MAG: CHAD domain-containing protein [Solirubrobacterales bacterium]